LAGEIPRYLDEVDRQQQAAWRHYSLAAGALQDGAGRVVGITFVMTNITQLKKAEAEMLSRMAQLRGLRSLAHVASSLFDWRAFHKQVTADLAHLFGAEKCIIFRWGQKSDHLEVQLPAYGLSWEGLDDLSLDVGAPDDPDSLWHDLEERDFILLNEDDKAPDSMATTFGNVDQYAAMMAVLRVGGRVHGTVLVAGRDSPFSDQDGQLLSTFAVPIVLAIEDAELEQRLTERNRQLAATRLELERLTQIVESARRPLTLVRGYLELLLDGTLGSVPDRQLATVNMLLDKTRELGDAFDQISPSEPPSQVSRNELLSLSAVLRRVLDTQTISMRMAGLNLVAHLPATDDEKYVVSGDEEALFSVFDALTDNAIKFSPTGGTIRVAMYESGEVVYASIADPGVGIDSEVLPGIWEPREEAEGTPIRLFQVLQIIEDHGGQVWGESELGQGSTFYVVLPKALGAT
jgi:signal transduction histidine kinase